MRQFHKKARTLSKLKLGKPISGVPVGIQKNSHFVMVRTKTRHLHR
jgi:hypothetical protein